VVARYGRARLLDTRDAWPGETYDCQTGRLLTTEPFGGRTIVLECNRSTFALGFREQSLPQMDAYLRPAR
jgi:hypothetical protein